jgi:hypothetical protein
MQADLEPGDRFHTVQPVDTLSTIAERFHADVSAFNRVFKANHSHEDNSAMMPPDARLACPGWRLLLPESAQRSSDANTATD